MHAYSSDVRIPVASEYIIMEGAPGVKLEDVWGDLCLEDKTGIVKDLIQLQKKMMAASFNWCVVMARAPAHSNTDEDLAMAVCTILAKLYPAQSQ